MTSKIPNHFIICPLCERAISPCQQSRHHLIPKSFKGKEVVVLHKICHHKIHSLLSERQLLKYYHTVAALRQHPDIKTFVQWLANKPPEFYVKTRSAHKKKRS